jgi:lipopolysaccharide transport system permease protein
MNSSVLIPCNEPATSQAEAGPGSSASPSDGPLTVLGPRSGWQLINLRELWRYRELLYFLIWRDVKVRYKQTALGAAWAVLQPFVNMVVFSLFFSRLTGAADPKVEYPLYVFAGFLAWTFFANAVSSAGQSVVGCDKLVTKVYFPRLIIPMGAVGAGLVDFVIAFGMLLGIMLFYGRLPGWGMVLVPLLTLGLVLLAVGVGALLAALTVAYRDFRFVVPFMIQVWMFATPTIYMQPEKVIAAPWLNLLPLNPAYGLIANFRLAVLSEPLELYSLAISGSIALLILVAGCLYFRRVEHNFADII